MSEWPHHHDICPTVSIDITELRVLDGNLWNHEIKYFLTQSSWFLSGVWSRWHLLTWHRTAQFYSEFCFCDMNETQSLARASGMLWTLQNYNRFELKVNVMKETPEQGVQTSSPSFSSWLWGPLPFVRPFFLVIKTVRHLETLFIR